MDLLIVDGQRILPVDIKCAAALDPRSLAGLRQRMQDLSLTRGFVVTTSSERRGIGKRIDMEREKFMALWTFPKANSARRQATRGFRTVKSGKRPKSRSAVQSSWMP
jgi:hypothetical protein